MISDTLSEIYKMLYDAFGPQHWWPGETSFEIMAGAILTQNTSWTNVEKAIANLKSAGNLTPEALHRIDLALLAELIRPAGYFNIKAKRLKSFVDWLFGDYGGELTNYKHRPIERGAFGSKRNRSRNSRFDFALRFRQTCFCRGCLYGTNYFTSQIN